jgi:hypothetical protein
MNSVLAEKAKLAAELEAERQTRLQSGTDAYRPRPLPMSIDRPGNVHEQTAMWA